MGVLGWLQQHALEAQVAAGLVLVLLPSLVRGPLWFPLCCLTPIWFLIAKLLIMRDTTVGSHLRLASQLASGLGLGVIWGGTVVSFVKAITVQGSDTELALMCVFGALGALPLTVGRPAAAEPVSTFALTSSVVYGTSIILCYLDTSVTSVWSQTIQWLLLSIALACAALVVVGCVVLPVTAAEEVAQGTAKVLVGTAKALDRCMALLCMPPQSLGQGPTQAPLATHTILVSSDPTRNTAQPAQDHSSANGQEGHATTASHVPSIKQEYTNGARNDQACGKAQQRDKEAARGTAPIAVATALDAHDTPQTVSPRSPSKRSLLEVASRILHDELDTSADYERMLYKATEPPPPPSDLALFKLAAHAAGDHLMPEGQALHLRRARDAVLRLLTVAASEPPLVHTLAAGWAQLRHRLTGGAPHTDSHTPWWQTQFSVPAWQQVLTRLGGVLDSLAALEAVARDLHDLAPSFTDIHHPHPHHHHQPHHHHHQHYTGQHDSKLHDVQHQSHATPAHHQHGPAHHHAHHHAYHATLHHHHAHRGPHSHSGTADAQPHESATTGAVSQGMSDTRTNGGPGPLAEARESDPSTPNHSFRVHIHKKLSLRLRSLRSKSAAAAAEEAAMPTVWQLWLLADGPQPAGVAPHASEPHLLHDSVRAALRDCAAQAQVLGGLAQAWPGPHADKAGADQGTGTGTGTPAELHTLSRDGPDYKPSKAGTPARPHRLSEDGLTRVGSITQQRLRAAVQRLRRSFESGAGPARRDPFRFDMEGAPDRLTYEQRHSMTWHNRALASAMLLRTRAYWSTTLRSLWQGAEAHQPLRLLRGDKIRAQYFVALTTHQAVCQMQSLISDLHTAHHPATAPDLPRTDPLGWAKQLLPLALATDALRYLGQSMRAGWQAVRGGREAMQKVFGTDLAKAVVKYWAVLALMVVVVLVLLGELPRDTFSTPPIFAYITASTVMRPQVETTSNQAVLRVLSTALGCVLGWALLSSPHSATEPVLVGAVIIITITLLTPITRTQFKLLAYVTSTTIASVTACQVSVAGCCSSDFTGSNRYALERFISVSVGVVAPVIVNHLITPWYLTYWALGRIAHSYDTAVTLLRAQYDQMVVQHSRVDHPPHPHLAAAAAATQQDGRDTRPDDTASHATHGSSQSHAAEPALARERTCPLRASPSKPPGTVTAVGVTDTQPNSTGSVAITIGASEGVQSDKKTGPSLADVQGPLTEVLGTLARDATLWQRGLLATPHAVHALMAAMTLMADRLAAVQVVLQGASAFSPVFSSWSATHLTTPLDPQVRKVLVAIGELSSLAHELLGHWKDATARNALAVRLRQQVQVVVALRFHAHTWHLKLRQALHVKVLDLALRTPSVQHSPRDVGQAHAHAPTSTHMSPPQADMNGKTAGREVEMAPLHTSAADHATTSHAALKHTQTHTPVVPSPFVHAALCSLHDPEAHTEHGTDTIHPQPQPQPHSPAVHTGVVKGTDVSDVPPAIRLAEAGRGLSALLEDSEFHPSDTVSWLACVYALTHAMDAAIHFARVAVVVSEVRGE